MPQLIAPVFFAAHPVLLFAANIATSALLSAVSSKLLGPNGPSRQKGLRGFQVTSRSAIEFRKVIYGQAAVSGPIVYQNTSGTNNSELWWVIPMAGHECEDLVSVILDDETVPKADIAWTAGTGGSDGTGTGAVSTAAFVGDNSTNGLYIYYYLGDAAQPVSGDLNTAFADIDTNHRGRGVTHIVVQASYVEDTATVWEGGPPQSIRAVLKGRKIYDPRLDSTNGGSGSHRYTDSTTWEWSENPALCVADYLMTYMNVAPATAINWTSFADAADDCEVAAAIPTATTEDRFTCNGVLSLGSTHKDNLDALLSSMDGRLSYTGGQWKVRASVWQTADFAIVENDLSGDIQIRGSADRSERFNKVRGVFNDPARDYQTVEFQHVTASEFQTRDNSIDLPRDIELPFTNSEYMAQRIAYRILEQGDNQIIAEVPLNYRGLKIAVGDTGTLTVGHLGWSAKSFRCINWKMQPDGTFVVTLKEDQSDSYTDPIEGEYTTSSTGGITLPSVTTAPPSSLTATDAPDGVQLDWTNPAARLFETIEVWASDDNDRSNAALIGETVRNTFTEILKENPRTRYYWIKAVSFDNRDSTWEPTGATSGVSGQPTSPSSNLVVDPDFDKTTSDTDNRFWGKQEDDGSGPLQSADVVWRSGSGVNSSNAMDLFPSGGSGGVTAISTLRRVRMNVGSFEFRIRYQTIGSTDSNDHTLSFVGISGYTAQTGGSASNVNALVTLPRNTSGWKLAKVFLDVPDNTSQFFKFRVGLTSNTASIDELRIDSINVFPAADRERQRGITIESPGASEDVSFFHTKHAITVSELRAVLRGSSTPSVTWTVRYNTDRSATGTELVTSGTTTTSTTSGDTVTSLSNNAIPADSFVWVETTAQSGTVDELQIDIKFKTDLELED